MRDTDDGIFGAAPRREFIGGAYCNYKVKEVFAKKRRKLFPPIVWDVEIVTTDPGVWWTFWSLVRPEPLLLSMEECGYPVDWRTDDEQDPALRQARRGTCQQHIRHDQPNHR